MGMGYRAIRSTWTAADTIQRASLSEERISDTRTRGWICKRPAMDRWVATDQRRGGSITRQVLRYWICETAAAGRGCTIDCAMQQRNYGSSRRSVSLQGQERLVLLAEERFEFV